MNYQKTTLAEEFNYISGMRNKFSNLIQNIVFYDEASFCQSGTFNSQNCIRRVQRKLIFGQ